ncbi:MULTISPECIES: 16S rRNA (guanine(527)-N(7))-methyltransferase RsmG [Rhodomicrobium]|uniref:16S rRNA (guanine(527)-N(7))-methyltransferase RsmG n=1 Tax=Rhodomicrobium TaxID=1068 RepID=UPI001FDA73D5|nr:MULTISPECIES: 16S rRNA (guanine(527)-N(7))-methyltransferase RsmG [Rhodomicrobium]
MMQATAPEKLLRIAGPADFAAAFDVPRETVERLETYAALLIQWQRAVNLVAPSTLNDVWQRHFADSAQLLARASAAKKWVDLGSGGGFPGLVIAILLANHENHIVHLIESNGRKCAFLSEVARRTGAPVKVHEGRIEDNGLSGSIGAADVVSSRALAPLKLLLGLAQGFFADRTVGLFLKGRDAGQEIAEAGGLWRFEHECIPSCTSGEGKIVEIKNLISQGDYSR